MTDGGPVQPVDASTVILVRHGQPVGTPWQCFMVRRPVRSEIAADVFVFPGGKVDRADRDPDLHEFVEGQSNEMVEVAESRDEWLSLKLAAIRELFEEAGVLLAERRDTGLLRLEGDEVEKFGRYREALRSGDISLLDLARDEDLRYVPRALHPFSRWITPASFPRRYDTRFFVGFMPAGQEPLHHGEETTEGVWIAPGAALEAYRNGTFPLVFATEKHLERMASFPSIEGMVAASAEADLQPVMPKVVEKDEKTVFLLPGERGY